MKTLNGLENKKNILYILYIIIILLLLIVVTICELNINKSQFKFLFSNENVNDAIKNKISDFPEIENEIKTIYLNNIKSYISNNIKYMLNGAIENEDFINDTLTTTILNDISNAIDNKLFFFTSDEKLKDSITDNVINDINDIIKNNVISDMNGIIKDKINDGIEVENTIKNVLINDVLNEVYYAIKKNINNTDTDVVVQDEIKNVLINNVINDIYDPKRFEMINELRKNTEIHSALWNSMFGRYDDKKYENNLEYYKFVLKNCTSFLTGEEENLDFPPNETKLLTTLHQSLYSWLYNFKYKSFKDLMESFNGKGLVISVGNKHFNFARSTIDNLRNIIKSEIPIEIFYNGDDDLSEDKRNILKEYDNVYISDLSRYFNNTFLKLEGFALKPFSILASRFEEVILIDADSVYLRDPALFFNDPGYIEKGTIFFEDRKFQTSYFKSYEWIKSFISHPLPETEKLRIWNKKTIDQMESSSVVINKSKNILGLLAACKLNEEKYRKTVYDHVYGDKETFWIGFEMARQPFYFNPYRPAYIAKVDSVDMNRNITRFCGHIGHRSADGKFMFWNGHLLKDKNSGNPELINFNIIVYDTDYINWNSILCGDISNEQFEKIKQPFDEYENKTLESILNSERKNHFIIPN